MKFESETDPKNSRLASNYQEDHSRIHDPDLLEFYRQMLRIRLVQLQIESLYHLDEMKTPIHLCIGQEAIAVGVCANLNEDDYVSSNHRGHGHYLAKGGDLRAMIAELYCRETGCSKGRGGSMHLIDTSVGLVGSSSIVGGGIPIATGLGLAIKMRTTTQVSVVFFGDGAADEGVLYESVNFAILKKLPVIYVLENNQFAVCSPVSARSVIRNPFHGLDEVDLFSKLLDGNDVEEIFRTCKIAVERARLGLGPSFLECTTYRLRGHAGAGDSPAGYRSVEELLELEKRCPVEALRKKLMSCGKLDEQENLNIQNTIKTAIDEAFRYAQGSPLPRPENLGLYLFKE